MPRTFERWKLEESTEGVQLRLEQKSNARVNLLFGVGLVAVALWLTTRPGSTLFGWLLFGFGALWVLLSLVAAGDVRLVRLDGQLLTLLGKGDRERDAWRFERVEAVTLEHDPGRRDRRKHFPWRVRIVDGEGTRFKGRFKLQEERPARELAATLAERLGVEVRDV